MSRALTRWQTLQAGRLDEIEAAHEAVGGTGRGRRYATQQIDDAYIVLLSAQFQMFCRDLHSEAATAVANAVKPASLGVAVLAALTQGRSLDRQNPQPGSIGSDFARFGMEFWPDVHGLAPRLNPRRQAKLEQLNIWRNGIAHQSFTFNKDDTKKVAGTGRTLRDARAWRRALDQLAIAFDEALSAHLTAVLGAPPW